MKGVNTSMDFTYDSYYQLLSLLKSCGYEVTSYDSWSEKKRCVILRHDIDIDIQRAVELAKKENEWKVQSTYFVLLTSNFYNVFSKRNLDLLQKIIGYGHEIGLHFDETSYPACIGNADLIRGKILKEKEVLELLLEKQVRMVSMHRASKEFLSADLQIPGMFNSYSNVFFHDFKYLSDSRRCWREPVFEIIKSNQYKRLHILTHAFWYRNEELDIHAAIKEFVNSGNREKYDNLNENIRDLEKIMSVEEILS